MMFLASLKTAQFWLKVAPWVVSAIALIGVVLWVRGMQSTIEEQREQISDLSGNLKSETAARERDVAGLTALAQGLAAAATTTKRDAQILSETIDAAHPTPSSPALAAFLASLRAADQAAKPAGPAGGAGR
jgi:peptidoglycan hydrolase CwlO-like protein